MSSGYRSADEFLRAFEALQPLPVFFLLGIILGEAHRNGVSGIPLPGEQLRPDNVDCPSKEDVFAVRSISRPAARVIPEFSRVSQT